MPETSKVEALQKQLGVDWPNLTAARTLTAARRQAVELAVEGFASADVSVVMAGSFARDELTSGSDPDWSLLVDGAADPHHFETAQAVGKKIGPLFAKDAGREKTFGTPSFSHDLVHLIGGQDDTNRNTTRRILLLLESTPVGRREAYDRVVNCVLDRYVLEDRTFAQKKSTHHVPRFLLNDIARYWRTMAVDFAYKARTRGGEGFAIRNFKLRMSRKLIYVSGMLSCFACELGMTHNGKRSDCTRAEQECVGCLRDFMCRPPLEVLSDTLLQLGPDARNQAAKIMGAYDRFLGILADDKKREALEKLDPAKGEDEDLFDRRKMTHDFRDGLLELFFDVPRVAALTRIYGVF